MSPAAGGGQESTHRWKNLGFPLGWGQLRAVAAFLSVIITNN